MSAPPSRLRFGALTSPVHRPDHDPTLQLEQDIAFAEHADALGFHEFWWGEHHSGGWQIIADPMLMAARAAAGTRRIRLGTGVTALAYHQPKVLLDSAVQLDHLTRGRFMLGVGAGALEQDSRMIGLDPMEARQAMAESLGAILQLLDGGSPVSITPRHAPWLLRDAYLHLMPYEGALDIRVAAFSSPAGPLLAGQHGLGMLSFASSATAGPNRPNRLTETWQQASESASRHRTSIPRHRWSVASPMHLATTEIEARRQVRFGIARYVDYLRSVLPIDLPSGGDTDDVVDAIHALGHGVVGTPSMAIEHIERVLEHSGGVGTFLVELADWSTFADARASLELFAREVVPHFSGSTRMRVEAYAREVERRTTNRTVMARAQDAAYGRYVQEHREVRSGHARPVPDDSTAAREGREAAAPSGPPRSALELVPGTAAGHPPTPVRGLARASETPRITTDELHPLPDPPRRRGRHAAE